MPTDLTSSGEFDDPSGLIVQYTTPINAGTGNYNTFLSIQDSPSETGFNTDAKGVLDDGQGPHTHSLLLSQLGTDTINGVVEYVFRLDVNEPNTAPDQIVNLDHLDIYLSPTGSQTTLANSVLVLSLGTSLTLSDHSSGSGTDDYFIYVPKAAVDAVAAANPGDLYFTLSAAFSGTQGGFEEFRALPAGPSTTQDVEIGIVKDTLVWEGSISSTLSTDLSVEGKTVLAGTQLIWTYTVGNAGNTPIPGADFTVTDDHLGVTPAPVTSGGFNIGDTNQDGNLDVGEQWVFVAGTDSTSGAAAIDGSYTNVGTVSGTFDPGGQNIALFATDDSNYNGVAPAIDIVKTTSGFSPTGTPVGPGDGIVVGEGTTVTWNYTVTNPGDAPLNDVIVVDDNGTPGNTADDFDASPVLSGGFNVGDANHNGLLDPGETWLFTASGTAQAGPYSNVGTASGDFTDDIGQSDTVTATDGSSYIGFTPRLGELTIGYWYNHDTSKSGGGAQGQWTPFLVSTANLSTHDSVHTVVPSDTSGKWLLLGDENGNLHLDPGETGVWISFDAAKELINSSQTANDTRQILLSQAIATQLNIDSLAAQDGHAHSIYAPNGLITDAVKWLTGVYTFADGTRGNVDGNHDGFINAGTTNVDYYTGSKPHFLTADANSIQAGTQILTSSSDAWNQDSITLNSTNNGVFLEDGEAIKNALMYYNQAQLVPDITGQFVEWTATSNITTNGVNDFWLVIP